MKTIVYKSAIPTAKVIMDRPKNLFSPLGTGIGGNQMSYILPPNMRPPNPKDLRTYIAPVQFARVRADISSIVEAVSEAEQGFYPHRVKLQRLFMGIDDNLFIKSCIERRRELTLLRDFHFEDDKGNIDEKTTELFQKEWFYDFRIHAWNAKLYGYSLIQISDIDKSTGVPYEISIVPREHVSPDRKNVTTFIYSIGGAVFQPQETKDYRVTENDFSGHAIWVPTISEQGHSSCGYGMYYNLAVAAVFLRNNLGFNADYVEMFAQPFRHAKTNHIPNSPEWNQLAKLLNDMGNSGWAITGMDDLIDFVDANKSGTGYQSYDNLEHRLKSEAAAFILGHPSAMQVTPGRLGSSQGGQQSPEQAAIQDKQTADGKSETRIVENALPKFRKLGMKIPEGVRYILSNDDEEFQAQKRQNDTNLVYFSGLAQAKAAGLEIADEEQVEEMTKIKFTKVEEPTPAEPMKVVKNFYDNRGKRVLA